MLPPYFNYKRAHVMRFLYELLVYMLEKREEGFFREKK